MMKCHGGYAGASGDGVKCPACKAGLGAEQTLFCSLSVLLSVLYPVGLRTSQNLWLRLSGKNCRSNDYQTLEGCLLTRSLPMGSLASPYLASHSQPCHPGSKVKQGPSTPGDAEVATEA